VVECDLAKVEVAGSNPVSRSKVLLKSPLAQRALFSKMSQFLSGKPAAHYNSQAEQSGRQQA
jgi:hypothetical protein